MTSELMLRRKLTFRAHGQQVVFIKKSNEKSTHVLLKAFLWALYLPRYPSLAVEIKIGDRYKPDVVALDNFGWPLFWGEAGQVSPDKIESLARRYRNTHLAIAKWDVDLTPFAEMVRAAVTPFERSAPLDLLNFPPDSAERFIGSRGNVRLSFKQVEWWRFPPPSAG